MQTDKTQTVFISALVSAIVGIVIVLGFGLAETGPQPPENNQPVAPVQNEKTVAATSSNSAVVDVVEAAKPSVVSIVVSKEIPQIERYFQEGPFGIRIPQQGITGYKRQQVGSGSGFFVSSDGLIVTNRHVVSDTEASYSAVTNDGKTLDLEVVDRDPTLDIAVLKAKNSTTSYPALPFGDSSKLRSGQKVIAIGNALGEFQNSVSTGVVSGLSRSIIAGRMSGNTERLEQVIQTDAAVNPGNSGGPLLNQAGQVVGVNVAIAQGSENVSFALPADVVQSVVESVKKEGEMVRPFLGVRYTAVTEEIAQNRDLQVERGALVVGDATAPAVQPGSPADNAGIRPGDVLLTFNGTKIGEDSSLQSLVRSAQVEEAVDITLLRDGERITVSATLQAAPDQLR
jgi:serine protease Do